MGVNGAQELLCFPHSSYILSHILSHILQQNKDIHTGLKLLEGEQMMTELSFLGNNLFKTSSTLMLMLLVHKIIIV